MSNERINLEDFIERCKLTQPYVGGSGSIELYSESNIKVAMLEFGKQLLELAAENANLSISSRGVETYFDNFYSGVDNVEVNKQSILDTIKQVE